MPIGSADRVTGSPRSVTSSHISSASDEQHARTENLKCWTKWQFDTPPGSGEDRVMAVNRLHDCQLRQSRQLDLSFCNLGSLPERLPDCVTELYLNDNVLHSLPDNLPPDLEVLHAPFNRLESLPERLPEGLIKLDVTGNLLAALPEMLPDNIRHLYLATNNLQRLPAHLPAELTELVASDNLLCELPEILPPALQLMNVADNALTMLPELPPTLESLNVNDNEISTFPPVLPAALQQLSIVKNRLVRLPDHLPEGLRELKAEHNFMTALPEVLPEQLVTLQVYDNRLAGLPARLPNTLTTLDFHQNQVTHLPESLLHIGRRCEVNAQQNPLTEHTVRVLVNMRERDFPRLPSITLTRSRNTELAEVPLLHETVSGWYPPELSSLRRKQWKARSEEENASAFSQFLQRLSETESNTKAPEFRNQVAEWLDMLADTPPIRALSFAISMEATETCEDRVIQAWNQMQTLRIVHNVEQGEYDHKLPDLVTRGREIFRLEKLDDIAQRQVENLNLTDQIEVFLAYQVKLRSALKLESVAPEMRFFDASGVDKNIDLPAAEQEVKRKESEEFTGWLAGWSPWQTVIRRVAPDRYQQTENALDTALNHYYPQQLEDELRELQLQDDPDAIRTRGNTLWKEIANAEYRQLSLDLLQEKQLTSLLDHPWTS